MAVVQVPVRGRHALLPTFHVSVCTQVAAQLLTDVRSERPQVTAQDFGSRTPRWTTT